MSDSICSKLDRVFYQSNNVKSKEKFANLSRLWGAEAKPLGRKVSQSLRS